MRFRIWEEWAKNNVTNILRLVIVLLFLGLAFWAITLNRYGLVIANRDPWLWLTVALVSVGPELAGIVIGVVTIDYLNERRQREQLRAQLIRQMGMNIRDVAVPAARELAHYGWLMDGSLIGALLEGADLGEANLVGANLSEANLKQANLNGAFLERANLSGALLEQANLRGADLTKANLSGAFSLGVNLSEAFLEQANLSGAFLWRANLSGARLWEADLNGAGLLGADLSEAFLEQANLSGAFLEQAALRGARLGDANLSGANLARADLSNAFLEQVDLSGANLEETNLSKVACWTMEHFEQAKILGGAIMPDEVQLGREETLWTGRIEGPTFSQWKAQYVARQERKGTRM